VVRGLVRVIDLLFVYKEADGTVGSIELGDLGAELEPSFVDLDGQLGGGLLDAGDVEEVAAGIAPGNSVATIVVETCGSCLSSTQYAMPAASSSTRRGSPPMWWRPFVRVASPVHDHEERTMDEDSSGAWPAPR
jgi:hypothetical protein